MKKVKVNAEIYVGNNKLATIQEVNDIVNDNVIREPKRELEFITENNVIKWRYKDESEFNLDPDKEELEDYVDNEEDNTTTYSSFKDKPSYRRGSSLL